MACDACGRPEVQGYCCGCYEDVPKCRCGPKGPDYPWDDYEVIDEPQEPGFAEELSQR